MDPLLFRRPFFQDERDREAGEDGEREGDGESIIGDLEKKGNGRVFQSTHLPQHFPIFEDKQQKQDGPDHGGHDAGSFPGKSVDRLKNVPGDYEEEGRQDPFYEHHTCRVAGDIIFSRQNQDGQALQGGEKAAQENRPSNGFPTPVLAGRLVGTVETAEAVGCSICGGSS
jgi:hypothetical protein